MEELIKEFLSVKWGYGDGNGGGDNYGDGYGNGYGDGYGNGYGDSYGSGYGHGDGYGNGYGIGGGNGNSGNGYSDGDGNDNGGGDYGNSYSNGYGDGDGNSNGLKSFNNIPVYYIDSLPTQIINIKHNIAQGFIINKDLTTTACFIIKQDNYFSHGSTIKEALQSIKEKSLINNPIKERISNFKLQYPDYNIKINGEELFSWHYILTGSCKMGRESFCKDHNIDISKTFTVQEFIDITKNSYGGDIIKQL